MKQFILLLLVVCLVSSCKDKYDEEEQHAQDVAEIQNYLDSNNIAYERTAGDVFYYIEEEGDNDGNPSISDKVVCDYVGFIFDDFAEDGTFTIFDGTANGPATFPLQNVIKGWQQGIPEMSRNASGRFFIPSTLAYGNQRRGAEIGENEILVFDITLIHFF